MPLDRPDSPRRLLWRTHEAAGPDGTPVRVPTPCTPAEWVALRRSLLRASPYTVAARAERLVAIAPDLAAIAAMLQRAAGGAKSHEWEQIVWPALLAVPAVAESGIPAWCLAHARQSATVTALLALPPDEPIGGPADTALDRRLDAALATVAGPRRRRGPWSLGLGLGTLTHSHALTADVAERLAAALGRHLTAPDPRHAPTPTAPVRNPERSVAPLAGLLARGDALSARAIEHLAPWLVPADAAAIIAAHDDWRGTQRDWLASAGMRYGGASLDRRDEARLLLDSLRTHPALRQGVLERTLLSPDRAEYGPRSDRARLVAAWPDLDAAEIDAALAVRVEHPASDARLVATLLAQSALAPATRAALVRALADISHVPRGRTLAEPAGRPPLDAAAVIEGLLSSPCATAAEMRDLLTLPAAALPDLGRALIRLAAPLAELDALLGDPLLPPEGRRLLGTWLLRWNRAQWREWEDADAEMGSRVFARAFVAAPEATALAAIDSLGTEWLVTGGMRLTQGALALLLTHPSHEVRLALTRLLGRYGRYRGRGVVAVEAERAAARGPRPG